MSSDLNVPGFGARRRTEAYYAAVTGILRTLRPLATLKIMADKLNAEGISTPNGLPWDRFKVSAYIRANLN